MMFRNGADVLLEDNLLGGRRANDFRQPAEIGRSPGSPALIPGILAQEEGLQTVLGGLAIPDGILTGAGEVTDGLILDRRDIDGRQIAGTHQSGELGHGAAIGFDAIPCVLRDQGRGHDPAAPVFLCEVAVEPVPTGIGFVDEDELFGFGGELSDKLVEVALASADGAQEDHLGVPLCRGIRYGDGFFVDIQTGVPCARVTHG